MDIPSLSPDELEQAIRAALPPEHQVDARDLARALVAAARGEQDALANPALRRALRALAGAEVQAGGTLIDFRGANTGDITIGDVAGGDVIKVSISAPPSQLAPQERRNRQAMIQKVRAIWIDGLLKQSLADTAVIEIGLSEQPGSVQRPLQAQYRELERPSLDLPVGTRVIDAFDGAGGSLLILGAPGSGKTTLLLELCRELLLRAEQDETAPIPVPLNLSSWGTRNEYLEQWLTEELASRYDIPRVVAQSWVAQDALLLLLDSLDEVVASHQKACVEAINTYIGKHLSPLVVSSRTEDYLALGSRLHLQGAVQLQPLSREKIDGALLAGGERFAGLRQWLADDPTLAGLATTPLMVSVLALSYTGLPSMLFESHTREGEIRTWVLSNYIRRMFRRGASQPYPAPFVLGRLRWLAQLGMSRNRFVLQLEQLQPAGLLTPGQQRTHQWLTGALAGLVYGLIVALAINQTYAFTDRLDPSGWLREIPGIGGVGAFVGLIAGFTAALLFGPLLRGVAGQEGALRWQVLTRGALYGIGVGVGLGVVAALLVCATLTGWHSFWLAAGPLYGILNGLACGITAAILPRGGQVRVAERVRWSWAKARQGISRQIAFGALAGAIVTGLLLLGTTLSPEASMTRAIALGQGLSVAALTPLLTMLLTGLSADAVETRIWPNQGIHRSLRLGLALWAASGLGITAVVAMVSFAANQTTTSPYQLEAALVQGPIYGATLGFLAALYYGWHAALQHGVLRAMLALHHVLPLRLVPFLEACVDRAFLYRVGGGYIFIHRLLMEHIAALTDEAIARLSAEIQAPRR